MLPAAALALSLTACSFPLEEFRATPGLGGDAEPPADSGADGAEDTTVEDGGGGDTEPVDALQPCEALSSTYRVVEGRCYWIPAGKQKGGSGADAVCAAAGGRLVTVSSSEQTLVTELATTIAGELWIGLVKETGGGSGFVWVSGEPEPYTNWAAGFPKAGGQCVVSRADGLWENRNCADNNFALCER